MASIDKMEWHYGGNYPKKIPIENSGTHMGMFLTWIIDNDLIGEIHLYNSIEDLEKVKNKLLTGRDFLIKNCREKLCDEDLNEVGNDFAKYYYSIKSQNAVSYFEDYTDLLVVGDMDIYEVKNTWGNYDKLKNRISARFIEWVTGRVICR